MWLQKSPVPACGVRRGAHTCCARLHNTQTTHTTRGVLDVAWTRARHVPPARDGSCGDPYPCSTARRSREMDRWSMTGGDLTHTSTLKLATGGGAQRHTRNQRLERVGPRARGTISHHASSCRHEITDFRATKWGRPRVVTTSHDPVTSHDSGITQRTGGAVGGGSYPQGGRGVSPRCCCCAPAHRTWYFTT